MPAENEKAPVTAYSLRAQGFLLEHDHDLTLSWHDWAMIGAWRGRQEGAMLDFLGRRPGPGRTGGYRWILLVCNNPDCEAVARVRVSKIEALVQNALPVPAERWHEEEGPTDG